MRRQKKYFTLTEMMIAISLGAISITMAAKVLIEYIRSYQQITAESHLISFAYFLKTRLEYGDPNGGIREAIKGKINSDFGNDDLSFPDLDEDNEGLLLRYETHSDITNVTQSNPTTMVTEISKTINGYVLDYNNTEDNTSRGELKVLDIDLKYLNNINGELNDTTSETKPFNIDLLDDGNSEEELVTLVIDVQYNYNDTSYNYRVRSDIPIINFNTD